jgi:deoxyribodipyrimidine photolyase-related protein
MAVVEGTLDFAAVSKQIIPLDSLEGFIRRVIGWREYMRAMYQGFGDKHRSSNELGAHAQLGDVWWNGQTGLAPYDTVVRKLKATGYATAVERSRVVGAALLLSDIDPAQVYQFVMSFFIDAYDWVVVPNVYSASQFAAGAVFSDVPMVQTSAWFMAQGYQKEPWCDIWDGLYWRCIEKLRGISGLMPMVINKVVIEFLNRIEIKVS